MSHKWLQLKPSVDTAEISYNAMHIGDSIWFATRGGHGESGMIEYNVKTKQKSIIKYPSGSRFAISWHNCCVRGSIVYIVNPERQNIIVFDTEQKTFAEKLKLPAIGIHPGVCCVNNSIHIVHAIDGSTKHWVYDIDKNCLRIVNEKLMPSECSHIQLFNYDGQLLAFGGYNRAAAHYMDDVIMIENVNSQEPGQARPKLAKLANAGIRFGIVQAQSRILVFGGYCGGDDYSEDIYVLDMNAINDGWVESTTKCPLKGEYVAILESELQVHLFNTYKAGTGSRSSHCQHFVLPLSEIVASGAKNENEFESKCAHCDTLTAKLDECRHEIANLKKKNVDLGNMMLELQENEQKLTMEIESLRAENKRLKRSKLQLEESEFLQWDADQVVDWLCSLKDGVYREHEEVLRSGFIKNSINGSVLHLVNSAELNLIGIASISDRAAICGHFQRLIRKHQGSHHEKNVIEGNTEYHD